jgi:hypothetical protein
MADQLLADINQTHRLFIFVRHVLFDLNIVNTVVNIKSWPNLAGSIPRPLVSTALVRSFRRVKNARPPRKTLEKQHNYHIFLDAIFPKTCLPQAPTRPNCATRSATPAGRSIPPAKFRHNLVSAASPCRKDFPAVSL